MGLPIHALENMRSRRAELVTQMRAILDTARGEDRQITAEEKQSYKTLEGEMTGLTETIELEETQDAVDEPSTAVMGNE